MLVARVVPNVTGLDKQFDYLVPELLRDQVAVGSLVRVPLHGRRVGGWVVALGAPDPTLAEEKLMPLAKWSSVGPSTELVELARWAAPRWGTDRLRPFLVAASPPTMVGRLPAQRRTVTASDAAVAAHGSGVWRIGPLEDPLPLVLAAAHTGPTLVLHPSPPAARAFASRLRREGLTAAVVPDEWASAAGGVDVVVGTRSGAWAPCPGMRAVVMLDEHDESYQEERTPTWHARDVVIERAARAGATCMLVSPCPTATALRWATDGRHKVSHSAQSSHWPLIEIDDRSDIEPWRRSLVGSSLIRALRDPGKRVVCVLNTVGRARLLACRVCQNLQRCERCEAAVRQRDDGMLQCPRCDTVRPKVCQVCGASAMSLVKPGVSRLREELEAAANRPVAAVTGESNADAPLPEDVDVYIGTEAVLHRVRNVDVVAFLDFDAELLAPRYRAGEQAVALLVRAGRLVGARDRGGRVIVQTYVPQHEVLQAAMLGDAGRVVDGELARRRLLGLPPFRALAAIEGADAEAIAALTGLEFASSSKCVLVRADDWLTLGHALADAVRARSERRKGSRLRVEVDPSRV